MNKFAEIKKRRRVAYHEAGHAVTNLIFGLPFQSVSLKQEQKSGYLIEDGQKADATFIYTIGIVFPKERIDSVNKALMVVYWTSGKRFRQWQAQLPNVYLSEKLTIKRRSGRVTMCK